jgi:hypothetical protein
MNNALAMIISWMIFGVTLLLSMVPDGSGGIRLNFMTLFMGAMLAVLVYVAFTFKGIPKSFQIPMIPCINCGKGMPMDAIFCPYCGHKYQ